MADNLLTTLQNAGFKGPALRTAWAIAKRESGGRPDAYNPNRGTGDNSYGLFQINMLGKMGEARRRQFGLQNNKQLFDPVTNAKVAFAMSKGGTDFGPWGVGPNAYRKTPALDFSGFPNAGAAAPSGGGVQAASAPMMGAPQQQNNGMNRTLAIIDHFRQQRAGQDNGILPLIGQLMQLRQQPAAMPQMASPGMAEYAPAGGGTLSASPGIDVKDVTPDLLNTAKTWGLQVTSGYRSPEKQAALYANRSASGSVAAPGKSWHNQGRAVDVAPDAKGKAFLQYAFAHPEQFREVFYDPAGKSIKNGKIVNYTIGGHSDHIHVAQ